MDLRINSEYGTLKEVLMHRPGREIDRLTPYNKKLLLFEDVPYLEEMQREHDQFTQAIKQGSGSEVLYFRDLLMDILTDNEVLLQMMRHALAGAEMSHLAEELIATFSNYECAQSLVCGIKVHEAKRKCPNIKCGELMEVAYLIPPTPNLYFQRDTAAVTPAGMVFSSMKMEGRQREANMVRKIFEVHPRFQGRATKVFPLDGHDNPASLEGGDIIILSPKAVAIGHTERTDEKAVYHLAKRLIAEGTVERVYEVELPKKRNFMHLDTVFTILDENLVLTYPDALNAVKGLSVYRYKNGNGDKTNIKRSIIKDGLLQVLKDEIPHLQTIQYGSEKTDHALREQWYDGANVITIAPRKVISYNRNKHTNRALRDRGVEVLEIPSSELCRGLGGPRCMTMPISRKHI